MLQIKIIWMHNLILELFLCWLVTPSCSINCSYKHNIHHNDARTIRSRNDEKDDSNKSRNSRSRKMIQTNQELYITIYYVKI